MQVVADGAGIRFDTGLTAQPDERTAGALGNSVALDVTANEFPSRKKFNHSLSALRLFPFSVSETAVILHARRFATIFAQTTFAVSELGLSLVADRQISEFVDYSSSWHFLAPRPLPFSDQNPGYTRTSQRQA